MTNVSQTKDVGTFICEYTQLYTSDYMKAIVYDENTNKMHINITIDPRVYEELMKRKNTTGVPVSTQLERAIRKEIGLK